jgi:hypothetical protein
VYKRQLEETRKVMIGQSKTYNVQQFENTFFKLLNNHSKLIQSFEIGVPSLAQLDGLASKLKLYTEYYVWALRSKKIIGFQLFNYNPTKDSIFKNEVVGKIIDDINHTGNFILSKEYFNKEDYLFYFTTLFNSLYDCEKYFYGFQADLKLKEFYNVNTEKINSTYNDFYNESRTFSKIKTIDSQKFYPTLEVYLENSNIENKNEIPLMSIYNVHPLLCLENHSDNDITIKEIIIHKRSELNVIYGTRLGNIKDIKLKSKELRLRIDLFDYINLNYFKGELGQLLLAGTNESLQTINKYLNDFEKLEDRIKNYLIVQIPIVDSNGNQYDYYGELFIVLPTSHNYPFKFEIVTSFDDSLKYGIKM